MNGGATEGRDGGDAEIPGVSDGLVDEIAARIEETLGRRGGGRGEDAGDGIPVGEVRGVARECAEVAVGEILKSGLVTEWPAENGRGVKVGDGEGLLETIRGLGRSSLDEIRELWEERDEALWAGVPASYVSMAELCVRRGCPFWAYDVAGAGLKFSPGDLRLRQLQALVLARTGATRAGRAILEELVEEGNDDVETISLLGRVFKDLWARGEGETERNRALEQSLRCYRRVYEQHDDYYPGINTAALLVLMGRREEAVVVAGEVAELCAAEIGEGKGNYWNHATMGEAQLIQGDLESARQWYRRGVELAVADVASVATTRRQARRLMAKMGMAMHALDDVLPVPGVAVFAGHRMDGEDGGEGRFAAAAEESTKRRLAEILETRDIGIGYASAADGGDILFHEAVLERGGETHVVLPMSLESFRRLRVCGDGWLERFERVIESAASVRFANHEEYTGDAEILVFGNQVMLGLGRLEARVLDSRLTAVALWDGEPAGGIGETAHCVACWRALGCDLAIVAPGEDRVSVEGSAEKWVAVDGASGRVTKAVLFADLAGYSKLEDRLVPAFVREFMGRVGELCAEVENGPLIRNTWGDAFYFVFDEVRHAGHLALLLRDLVADTDWAGLGFKDGFGIRIALHAGPLYECVDPVTNQRAFTGQHVSRAARIEPIVEEGQIFASEAFAALAAAESDGEFDYEYVGERLLAKNCGSDRLFLLRRGDRPGKEKAGLPTW